MSNDALERLKQRQRPTVPMRDASLASDNTDISISTNIDTSIPKTLETQLSQPVQDIKDTSTSRYLEVEKLSQEVIEQIKTKQSTLRLEAQLSDRLSTVCRENGISREVLLEALFQYYESEPEAWKTILGEAKRRAEQRQQLANFKRAQSMMQRFGEQS